MPESLHAAGVRDTVVVENEGSTALVRIDRPEVHNALNAATLRALRAAVRALAADARVRAVVITGTGDRAFSAGADLDELAGLDAASARTVLDVGQQVMSEIEASPVPVLTAVNGLALGGGFELVLASTFPVLSTRASLGLPESGLGLIPGYGGTQRLPRAVGARVAAHLMLTGTRLSAGRAYELGLSPIEPVEPEELLPVALRVADEIAARGPRASTAILQALRAGGSTPEPAALRLETALAAIATGSLEAAEGIAAFRERRTPSFPAPQEARR